MVDDGEARRGAEIVDTGDVRQQVEGELRPVAQRAEDLQCVVAVDLERRLAVRDDRGADLLAERRAQALGHLLGRHSHSQRSLAPLVEQADHREEQEDRHRREAAPAELPEDDRVRVHEHHLDVEDDEEDGGQVELDREAPPGGAARLVAALERIELGGRQVARAQEAVDVHHHRHDDQRQGEGDEHRDVLSEHDGDSRLGEVSNTVAYAKLSEVSTRLTTRGPSTCRVNCTCVRCVCHRAVARALP